MERCTLRLVCFVFGMADSNRGWIPPIGICFERLFDSGEAAANQMRQRKQPQCSIGQEKRISVTPSGNSTRTFM